MASYVDSVSPTSAQRTAEVSKKKNDELGKDAFLQLLVTQMQNQDPLNPTEDTEFISQLATFSSLEQMQNMNASMQVSQASSLIGKQVTWQEVDETGSMRTFYATVESVRVDGSTVYLVVDSTTGKEITMSQVKLIEDPNTNSSSQASQAAALIGKTVSWYEYDKDGKPIEKTGEVSSIKVGSGVVYLVVGKDDKGDDIVIPLSSVASIKNPGETTPPTEPETPTP